MTIGDPLRIDEVADCAVGILRHLSGRPDDACVKLAALKSAASLVENAIATAAMTQTLNNLLGGDRR